LVKRIVVASSDKAYEEQEQLPYREEMPLVGRQPYEVSKSCADLISQAYFQTYRLPVTLARCGSVYGGGDLNWSRIVPGTIRSLLRGESPILRSDGKFIRDYIYVKDVSSAYLRWTEGCFTGSLLMTLSAASQRRLGGTRTFSEGSRSDLRRSLMPFLRQP
jgi:CDP-glucose 4,6-dehydratase